MAAAAAAKSGSALAAEEPMPWRAFLRNTPVRALAYTHFCNNWCALSFGIRTEFTIDRLTAGRSTTELLRHASGLL